MGFHIHKLWVALKDYLFSLHALYLESSISCARHYTNKSTLMVLFYVSAQLLVLSCMSLNALYRFFDRTEKRDK